MNDTTCYGSSYEILADSETLKIKRRRTTYQQFTSNCNYTEHTGNNSKQLQTKAGQVMLTLIIKMDSPVAFQCSRKMTLKMKDDHVLKHRTGMPGFYS